MNISYVWRYVDPDPALTAHLANKLSLPHALARVLVNRGVTGVEHAERFMNPSVTDLHDPYLMNGMGLAVERLLGALERHEKMLVIGDYDVDGITATALLVSFIGAQGGHIRYYIPERETEGYGVSEEMVRKAKNANYSLIITVDCGVSCNPEAAIAKELGIDMIITDHHEQPVELPVAVAVLDPKRTDTQYPFRELAGVGVVFKLIAALGARLGIDIEDILERYSEFVALGTVSDLVPLLDENRFFAQYGLNRMSRSRNMGIYSLLDVTGIRDSTQIDAHHISFGLAPRLNAAGRVWRPRAGVELLLASSPERARSIALKLDEHNRRRIEAEAGIVKNAMRQLDLPESQPNDRAVVLFSEDWQIGVVGIVASRIIEQRHLPVILTTVSRNPEDLARADEGRGRLCQGSARSVPGFDLFRSLGECSELLVTYGGHALAAGLKIFENDIPKLRARLNEIAKRELGDDPPKPVLNIDADIPLSAANMELVRQSKRLNPFGSGNPQPLFSTQNVLVMQPCRAVGADGRHLQFRVGQGTTVADVIAFGFCPPWSPEQLSGEHIDIAYNIKEDNFTGRKKVKLHLKDMRVSRPE